MERGIVGFVGVLFALVLCVSGATAVKVVKDGQGAYAKADEGSKFASLSVGTVLAVREESGDGWVKVVPPPTLGCWIFGDTVSDGCVSSGIGRLRTAPNPTAPVVATLRRGDGVTVLGKEGEWVKVVPPATASIWVRRSSVVDTSEAPTKASKVVAAEKKPVVVPPVVVPAPVVEMPKEVRMPVEQKAVETKSVVGVETSKLEGMPVLKPEVKPVVVPKEAFVDVKEVPVRAPSSPYVDSDTVVPKWVPPEEDRKVVKREAEEEEKKAVVVVPVERKGKEENGGAKEVSGERKVVRSVGPSPASGKTVVWPVSGREVGVQQTGHSAGGKGVKKSRMHSDVVVERKSVVMDEGGDWESFGKGQGLQLGEDAERSIILREGEVWLPRRAFQARWEGPTSGTLLKRRVRTQSNCVAMIPAGVSVERLRQDVYQGERGGAEGILVREDGGIRMRPSVYSLQRLNENGKSELIAYVLGSDAQLKGYIGQRVQVVGTCWWLGDSAAALSPTEPLRKVR